MLGRQEPCRRKYSNLPAVVESMHLKGSGQVGSWPSSVDWLLVGACREPNPLWKVKRNVEKIVDIGEAEAL